VGGSPLHVGVAVMTQRASVAAEKLARAGCGGASGAVLPTVDGHLARIDGVLRIFLQVKKWGPGGSFFLSCSPDQRYSASASTQELTSARAVRQHR
jgi:hypothetical protein